MLGTPRADEWRAQLGSSWRLHLAALVALWFIGGLLRPPDDPDLPRHLALAEWMLTQRAFPYQEPWAWTRAGAPFYAYSWLPELAQYGLFRVAGEYGLRLFNALLLLASALSVLMLARAARWRPWTVLVVALLHVGIAGAVAGGQRPGVVLLATIPIAWAASYALLSGSSLTAPLIWIVVANVLAANSHILFPAMLAPLALLFTRPGVARRTIVLAIGATVGGWLLSPYGLVWPRVFLLNFGANALFSYPTPIAELTPGFIAAIALEDALIAIALGLALLPWITAPRLSARERAAFALLWLGGLGLFAIAVRGVVLWWLVTLPLVAAAIAQLREPSRASLNRAQLGAMYAVSLFVVIGAIRYDRASHATRAATGARSLPTPANAWVDPAASWLECHTRSDAAGRLFNVFNYGDYLTWRLPRYSVSIDGRNIFPDSVARAEGYGAAAGGGAPPGPWRSADVAMIPEPYPVAAVLDSAPGWRRVLTYTPQPPAPTMGTWVREEWWTRSGRTPLPLVPEKVAFRRGASYVCRR